MTFGGARRAATLACVAAALAGAMSACYGEGPFRSAGDGPVPMTVAVRDADSGRPVEGAVVVAEVPGRDHPLSAATLFGETTPGSSRGATDSRGMAHVTGMRDRPVRLVVMAAGTGGPVFVVVDPNPADLGQPGAWLDLAGAPGRGAEGSATRRLQARIEP